jgi:hypothetical protein
MAFGAEAPASSVLSVGASATGWPPSAEVAIAGRIRYAWLAAGGRIRYAWLAAGGRIRYAWLAAGGRIRYAWLDSPLATGGPPSAEVAIAGRIRCAWLESPSPGGLVMPGWNRRWWLDSLCGWNRQCLAGTPCQRGETDGR